MLPSDWMDGTDVCIPRLFPLPICPSPFPLPQVGALMFVRMAPIPGEAKRVSGGGAARARSGERFRGGGARGTLGGPLAPPRRGHAPPRAHVERPPSLLLPPSPLRRRLQSWLSSLFQGLTSL